MLRSARWRGHLRPPMCHAVGATVGLRDPGGALAGLRRGPCAFRVAMVVQSSLWDNISTVLFYGLHLWVAPTVPHHRHLRAWVSSGRFWKRHDFLIYIMKWPSDFKMSATDRSNNCTSKGPHLTGKSQVTMRQLELFYLGFLFLFMGNFSHCLCPWSRCVMDLCAAKICK